MDVVWAVYIALAWLFSNIVTWGFGFYSGVDKTEARLLGKASHDV